MIPDIVEIKRLCASGQWIAKIENGKILLNDTVAGETVCIGQTDAEPVRRGQWKRQGTIKSYKRLCTECGKECYFCGEGCSYKFCPNCGAKMGLEAEPVQKAKSILYRPHSWSLADSMRWIREFESIEEMK